MGIVSHWVKVYDGGGGLIWEGIIDGYAEMVKDQKVFRFEQNSIPLELRKALNTNTMVRTEWEPAWEELPINQIEGGNDESWSDVIKE